METKERWVYIPPFCLPKYTSIRGYDGILSSVTKHD